MSELIRMIGAIVYSFAMYSIPILLTLSIVYNWDGFFKLVLVAAAFSQVTALSVVTYDKSWEDKTAILHQNDKGNSK